MTHEESKEGSDFIQVFERKTKEIFSLDANREKVGELAYNGYKTHFGCSQSILGAFQEVLGFKDDFWFKALAALQGGGSSGLTCGALATGLILLGTRLGRDKAEDGFKGILTIMEPSWTLTNWFKMMWKSTVCSEITGVNWFDLNEIVAHYTSPRGMDTIEQCAKLTGGTAHKVAEMLSQL